MLYEISNGLLRATVSEAGAELQSLQLLSTGREYIWHGDATWWHGRSPILFPIVGRFWEGVGRDGETELRMAAHGFARKQTWQLTAQSADSLTFTLTETPETLALWPHRFRLDAVYTLVERRLEVKFAVQNPEDEALYFQIGGHPAISLPEVFTHPVSGYLQPHGGTPHSMLRAGEGGCLEPDRVPCPVDAETGWIPFDVRTFVHEALILDGHQISGVTVLDGAQKPLVRISSTAPVWLFWQPMYLLTPFICCEPWYGLPDRQHFHGDYRQRPEIQMCAPSATWHGGFEVEVL